MNIKVNCWQTEMKLTGLNVKGQMHTRTRLSQSAKAWQVIHRLSLAIIPTVKPEVFVAPETKWSRYTRLLERCATIVNCRMLSHRQQTVKFEGVASISKIFALRRTQDKSQPDFGKEVVNVNVSNGHAVCWLYSFFFLPSSWAPVAGATEARNGRAYLWMPCERRTQPANWFA